MYKCSAREDPKLEGDQVPSQELHADFVGNPILVLDPDGQRSERNGFRRSNSENECVVAG